RQAALVAIQREKAAALAAFRDPTDVTVFAAAATVHPDHVRAHVRQQHGAIGPGDKAAKIDDANSLQRQSCHSALLTCASPALPAPPATERSNRLRPKLSLRRGCGCCRKSKRPGACRISSARNLRAHLRGSGNRSWRAPDRRRACSESAPPGS